MSKQKEKTAQKNKELKQDDKSKVAESAATTFAFDRKNYRLLFIGLAFIIVGFLLMIGGGSDDPDVFNEDIFSFRRLTLAPILVLAGYVIEIFAIMRKPKN